MQFHSILPQSDRKLVCGRRCVKLVIPNFYYTMKSEVVYDFFVSFSLTVGIYQRTAYSAAGRVQGSRQLFG